MKQDQTIKFLKQLTSLHIAIPIETATNGNLRGKNEVGKYKYMYEIIDKSKDWNQ